MRYALIRIADNVVRNVIEFEEGGEWSPDIGYLMVPSETLNVGDVYNEGEN